MTSRMDIVANEANEASEASGDSGPDVFLGERRPRGLGEALDPRGFFSVDPVTFTGITRVFRVAYRAAETVARANPELMEYLAMQDAMQESRGRIEEVLSLKGSQDGHKKGREPSEGSVSGGQRTPTLPPFMSNLRMPDLSAIYREEFGEAASPTTPPCTAQPPLLALPFRPSGSPTPIPSSPLIQPASPAHSQAASGASTPRSGRRLVPPPPMTWWQRLWAFIWALPARLCGCCRQLWNQMCSWVCGCVGNKKSY
ncbi:unnamed protein product [Vitrella brassicaformis CCMP3155]|uniref:Uncharacterized protein n=1 Tax=Vitrella brassicaformis (strain CCMP3155) TaxID=1169540 RepID=A0A0G4FHK3_VITBC|nr:unnamed protein product [Vitrella brassicaformis CCMP3155]|eukprot:CEM12910.1 unnamed protein product [Vitrella brassicaformis CCMP3155]